MSTEPTTTSYALLGLLATQSFTAYDLTQQMRRGLRWAWPRSEANLYNEAKRLVRLGWAKGIKQRQGQRTRTRYEITDTGREALAGWLGEPPAALPQFESETMLRVFFADHGDASDLRATVEQTRRQLRDVAVDVLPVLEGYEAGDVPFPGRMHLVLLYVDFIARFYSEVSDWLDAVDAEAATWDSTVGVGMTPSARRRLDHALEFWRGVAVSGGGSGSATTRKADG